MLVVDRLRTERSFFSRTANDGRAGKLRRAPEQLRAGTETGPSRRLSNDSVDGSDNGDGNYSGLWSCGVHRRLRAAGARSRVG
jgi:hypothetical protein